MRRKWLFSLLSRRLEAFGPGRTVRNIYTVMKPDAFVHTVREDKNTQRRGSARADNESNIYVRKRRIEPFRRQE